MYCLKAQSIRVYRGIPRLRPCGWFLRTLRKKNSSDLACSQRVELKIYLTFEYETDVNYFINFRVQTYLNFITIWKLEVLFITFIKVTRFRFSFMIETDKFLYVWETLFARAACRNNTHTTRNSSCTVCYDVTKCRYFFYKFGFIYNSVGSINELNINNKSHYIIQLIII